MPSRSGNAQRTGLVIIEVVIESKMAATAILDFVVESQEVPTVILFYKVYFDFKFDENRLIGSKVTAVFQNIDSGWDFSI